MSEEQKVEQSETVPSQETAEDPATDAIENEAQIKKCLKDADELKQEGNEHFRAKRWGEALAVYRAGLGRLPKRKQAKRKAVPVDGKGKGRETEPSDSGDDGSADGAEDTEGSVQPETEEEEKRPLSELEQECAKARSVMNANIGACHVKLGEHKEAVAACTEALADDPHYVKALQRRAQSNEQINSWSSLSAAQEDYTTLLSILPPTSTQLPEIRRSLALLKPRAEAAQKRETDEMLDKLKGLGNNVLGKFGLSTNNFQFVPNGQGGYSMNFVR
ncbi:TPR-like protein [Laetiporus sulphureus 93-53]|uniref:TPR-like protein n=1 Tax=Laetiporus sulphureus 93-53 TaxID=1314785 RepID=A0A165DZ16_9APHY|nr:TPR-like protein [Laetiporus sulphureus 93-53]KZT05924.1 TPR-like protein [Laetiporus sulphureus 93-53]